MTGLIRLLDFLNRRGKGWACRLVQLTSKYPERIHPKHLVPQDRAWFLDYLKPGDWVLDLGCGTGDHGLAAARVVSPGGPVRGRITWCDRNPWPFGHSGHRFVVADLEDPLPFKDHSFDAVLMLDVLEHLHNRGRVLAEVKRILKPSGYLFLAVPNAWTTWRQRLRAAGLFAFSDPEHQIEYSAVDITVAVSQAGFCLDSLAPVPAYDTPWAGLIDLIGGLHLPTYRRLVAWKRRMAIAYPNESTGFLVTARAA